MLPLFYLVLPVVMGGLALMYVKRRRARKASGH
jgi:hypothetical protein